MDKREEQSPSGSVFKKPGPSIGKPGPKAKPSARPSAGASRASSGPASSSSNGSGSPFQSQGGGAQFRRTPHSAPAPGRAPAPVPARDVRPPEARSAAPPAQDFDDVERQSSPATHDGWDRPWAAWSRESEAEDGEDDSWDEGDGWAESREEGRLRMAWGQRPEEGTMASISISAVQSARRERQRSASYEAASYQGESYRSASYNRNYDNGDYSEQWSAPSRREPRSRAFTSASGGQNAFQHTMASIALQALDDSRRVVADSRNAFVAVFRWVRSGLNPRLRPPKRAISLVLLISILGTLFLSGAGMGLWAYTDYKHIEGTAKDGQQALEHIFTDLGIGKSGSTGQKVTDAQIQAAQNDLAQARADFQDLHDRLTSPDLILTIAGHVSSIKPKLESGKILGQVALDATDLINVFMPTLIVLANVISSSPIATATNAPDQGLLQASDFPKIQQSLNDATPLVNKIVAELLNTDSKTLLSALPASSQASIQKYLQFLPLLPQTLNILQTFMPVLPTLLGVTGTQSGAGANYLIMTLDSAEIRPVGGFQGQFAILSANAGHFGQIQLRDVYQIEPIDSTQFGYESVKHPLNSQVAQFVPQNANESDSWLLNSLGWALRNSGTSPDFAQSAENALYQLESEIKGFGGMLPTKLDSHGRPVSVATEPSKFDGVIMFQSSLISQVLAVTGTIHIPAPYNVDVTAQNVSQQIHYFQETDAGRLVGQGVQGNSTATKRFTELLSQALLAKVRSVDKSKLIGLIGTLVNDFHSKDIMMYFRNPDAEKILEGYQISNEIYQGTTDDSLIVNEANISGNKIDQFLTETITDNVSLSKTGTATHNLQIDYQFDIPKITGDPNKLAPDKDSMQIAVYNTIYNAKYDQLSRHYRRIYISPRAQLSYANYSGFPVNGDINAVSTTMAPEFYPTADVPNHRIIGGYYVYMWQAASDGSNTVEWRVPDGEPSVHVRWTVPTAFKPGGNYVLHVQRQSGVNLVLNMTITSPCNANTPLTPPVSNQHFTTDQVFTVAVPQC